MKSRILIPSTSVINFLTKAFLTAHSTGKTTVSEETLEPQSVRSNKNEQKGSLRRALLEERERKA